MNVFRVSYGSGKPILHNVSKGSFSVITRADLKRLHPRAKQSSYVRSPRAGLDCRRRCSTRGINGRRSLPEMNRGLTPGDTT
jgi:hypothetical protein